MARLLTILNVLWQRNKSEVRLEFAFGYVYCLWYPRTSVESLHWKVRVINITWFFRSNERIFDAFNCIATKGSNSITPSRQLTMLLRLMKRYNIPSNMTHDDEGVIELDSYRDIFLFITLPQVASPFLAQQQARPFPQPLFCVPVERVRTRVGHRLE